MKMTNKKFYTSSLKRYGSNVKALHWNSTESQTVRFEQILKLLPHDLSAYSVVDAGCGFADLYRFLVDSNQTPKCYVGLDSLTLMVEEARTRVPCKIIMCDILTDDLIEADFYLCSGAMNIMSSFETELFIRRCYEASRMGFIFNVLWGEKEQSIYNYLSVSDIHATAQRLGATCKIFTGYLERDITVAFYKEMC
jgi:SAM-dependent methyltransferase